jgi:nitronate monooxygenase
MPLDPCTLELPIVGAPMAGGPTTPQLAAAVSQAGGLGFLAAGYKTPEALREEIATARALTDRPIGVNIFSAPPAGVHRTDIAAFARTLTVEAERYGVELGEPRFDDDAYDAKLEAVIAQRVPVVSFTFGCPSGTSVATLHEVDAAVWVTVTGQTEAAQAIQAGADVLVVQGTEAGGHRGYFDDQADHEELGLLAALRLIGARTELPLIAAGGITDGPAIAAVLAAGAVAAQLGTALLLADEAGTSPTQREWVTRTTPTRLTRAFSGRLARGIVNRFMDEHDRDAPRAYPEVHHLTTPVRAAARARGDGDAINLWAGQGHELARTGPAAELVRQLGDEAAQALRDAGRRLPG